MNVTPRTRGAYIDFDQIAGYHLHTHLLKLKRNRNAFAQLAGPYKTRIRGRGLEFEDVRIYQSGDDVRSIDWRVSARTNVPHIKQFTEEKERPVLIAVDQRQHMFFGSQCALKSVVAADIAAMIAWAVNHKGDRLGGLLFNNERHQDFRPQQQKKHILRFLFELSAFNQSLSGFVPEQGLALTDIFLEIKRLVKPGMQVFIISDFYDLQPSDESLLHQISRKAEIIALKPFDLLEYQLPTQGLYRISNGQQESTLDADNKHNHQLYQREYEQHADFIKTSFGQAQAPVIPIATSDEPLAILQQYLGHTDLIHDFAEGI